MSVLLPPNPYNLKCLFQEHSNARPIQKPNVERHSFDSNGKTHLLTNWVLSSGFGSYYLLSVSLFAGFSPDFLISNIWTESRSQKMTTLTIFTRILVSFCDATRNCFHFLQFNSSAALHSIGTGSLDSDLLSFTKTSWTNY